MVIDARIPLQAVARPVNVLEFEAGRQATQRSQANRLALEQGQTNQNAKTAEALARGVLSADDKPAAYRMALKSARRAGMNVDAFPTEWGPDADMALRMVVMDGPARTKLQGKIQAMRDAGYSEEDIKKAIGVDAGIVPRATAGGGAPKARTTIAKLEADYKAGLVDEETYKAAKKKLLGDKGGKKAPSGYRYNEGGDLEFIPGGPADPAVKDRLRGDGTTVYDPNTGKPLVTMGGRAKGKDGNIGLDKTGRRKVVEDIRAEAELLERMNGIAELLGIGKDGKLSPEARQLFTAAGTAKSAVSGTLGWLNSDIADGIADAVGVDREGWKKIQSERRKMVIAVEGLFNQYRKDITGAAAAVQELERLKAAYINKDMGPDDFEAAFSELRRIATKVQQLREGFVRAGIPATEDDFDAVYRGDKTIEDVARERGGGSPASAAAGGGDVEARFNELVGGGMSEEDAYRVLIEEGY